MYSSEMVFPARLEGTLTKELQRVERLTCAACGSLSEGNALKDADFALPNIFRARVLNPAVKEDSR